MLAYIERLDEGHIDFISFFIYQGDDQFVVFVVMSAATVMVMIMLMFAHA
ncbi:hypothetical protein PsJ27TS7_17980 [Paenibacillus dendritiformis]